MESKGKLDRASTAHSPKLIVARIDPSSKEDEEMDMNPRKGLKDLIAGRNKRPSSKKVSKSQVPANLPPPPPPPTTSLDLILLPNLKKKRKEQELEEGEVVPQKGTKQQKIAKDRQASSMDRMEDPVGAKVHR